MDKLSTNCRVIATLFCLALISSPAVALAQLETLPVQPTRELSNRPRLDADELNPTQDSEEAFEVVMRGPVHEAFAQAWQADPVEPPVITAQPPEPVAEVAPELQPEGNNIQWIPGYWSWDDSEEDFIWISGLWRDLPVDQIWNPGQWFENAGGWSWSPGFWSNPDAANQQALPAPPANIDNGPSHEAPGADFFYVPGNWLFVNNQYTWQAGYWCPRTYGRVWIPAQYFYGCNGFVFQAGFWDYPLEDRGVLFAPICFDSPLYLNVGWNYQPNCMVNTGVDFFVHLFAHPTRGYCFGDWYDCQSIGYRPWVYTHLNNGCYDPLFTYYGYRGYRHCETDDHLLNHLYKEHRHFADHKHQRPDRRFNHHRQEPPQRGKGRGLFLHDDPQIAAKLERDSAVKRAGQRGSSKSLGTLYRNTGNKTKQRMYRDINREINSAPEKLSQKNRTFPKQPLESSSPELMKARKQLLDQTQARINGKSKRGLTAGRSNSAATGDRAKSIDRASNQQRLEQALTNQRRTAKPKESAFRTPNRSMSDANRLSRSRQTPSPKNPGSLQNPSRDYSAAVEASRRNRGKSQIQNPLETMRRSQVPTPQTVTRDKGAAARSSNSVDVQSQMLRQRMLNQNRSTPRSSSLGSTARPTESGAKLRRNSQPYQSRGLSNQPPSSARTMRTPSQFGSPPANSRGSFSRPPAATAPRSNQIPNRGNSFRSGGTNMRSGASQFQSRGQGFSSGPSQIRKSPPTKRNPK